MILVTGATGHFGKSTIDFLLKKGISSTNIVALVRDEAKAGDLKAKGITIRTGDYHNYDSLINAFEGINKLLLVSSSDITDRTRQQQNVVSAAKEAGVKHILYTSTERKNETATSPIHFVTGSHIETENIIKASGIPYTIFRNNLYLDMLPIFFGQQVLEKGVFLPTGETSAAFSTRDDMAEAAANVLISDGHENKDYGISNTENVSVPEIVKSLGEVVGKEIGYVSPTSELFIETMTKAGVPEQFVGMFAGFSEAIRQGEFETFNTDLEMLLGRKPVSAKEFLTGFYAPKN
ncbi:SDR family oxidoreductase [Mucilaginibacter sp. FT3.2]|uniref:SDR family oxidoreductase n=1 Tax=Mucilaginibacter sp. FT3.2 TaxID=2723090 RepID=UPI0016211A4B|nr:SDR family oxidoreductase [Mucilaginibacter sp. FT3.2]MBB6232769.1 NAD(P)H dehydrogenase (quinone) [Mucilaginibacter sp. FT3.2]